MALLAEMARVLKPKGRMYVQEAVTSSESGQLKTKQRLQAVLKMAGFVNLTQVPKSSVFVVLINENKKAVKDNFCCFFIYLYIILCYFY